MCPEDHGPDGNYVRPKKHQGGQGTCSNSRLFFSGTSGVYFVSKGTLWLAGDTVIFWLMTRTTDVSSRSN